MARDFPERLLLSFLTGEQRLLLTWELCEFDRAIRKQKIRRQYPEWCEMEVVHEIIRQAFLPKPTPVWLEKRMKQRLDMHRAANQS